MLVAIDLGEHAADVVDEAGRWAERLSATVDLLFVDETPDASAFVTDPILLDRVAEEQARMVEAHRVATARLLERLTPARRGQAITEHARPAEAILARAPHYDLVLLATHGRQGMARVWLGSIAEKIVRLSPVPVLVTHL